MAWYLQIYTEEDEENIFWHSFLYQCGRYSFRYKHNGSSRQMKITRHIHFLKTQPRASGTSSHSIHLTNLNRHWGRWIRYIQALILTEVWTECKRRMKSAAGGWAVEKWAPHKTFRKRESIMALESLVFNFLFRRNGGVQRHAAVDRDSASATSDYGLCQQWNSIAIRQIGRELLHWRDWT